MTRLSTKVLQPEVPNTQSHQQPTMPEIQVGFSDIPTGANVDLTSSTYFKSWKTLPPPAEVRAAARQKAVISAAPNLDPPPVLFREKRLWVKWGSMVRLSEGQSLYMVNKHLAGTFPAPEIYGWRTDNGETFLYCQWLEGQTLEQAWDVMTTEDKVAVSHELQRAFENLRRLRQHPQQFIGTAARSTIYDRCLGHFTSHAGPFQSVKDFHDWFARAHRARIPGGAEHIPIEPFRYQLPDDAPIRFTMSDLHPRNIIVSTRSKRYSLVGVVDLEQSAWLPEYWEDLKARWTVDAQEDWAKVYLSVILPQTPPDVADGWQWYEMSIGP